MTTNFNTNQITQMKTKVNHPKITTETSSGATQ